MQKQAAVAKSHAELEAVQSKIEEISKSLEEADKGREDTVRANHPSILRSSRHVIHRTTSTATSSQAERRKLLSTLADEIATNKSLTSELAAFGAADPERYERKRRAVQVAKDAAVRWTGEYPLFWNPFAALRRA